MNIELKWFVFICGVVVFFIVMRLLLKRKINERYTVVWLIGAFFILLLSANPKLLDKLATFVGIDYPPSLLFLFSALMLLIIALYQTIQISTLHGQLTELAQNVALLTQTSNRKEAEKQEDRNNESSSIV